MANKKKQQAQSDKMVLLAKAGVAFVLTYIAALWAIDSGWIPAYIIGFIGFYYGVFFTKEAVKKHIKNDKTRKAKKS